MNLSRPDAATVEGRASARPRRRGSGALHPPWPRRRAALQKARPVVGIVLAALAVFAGCAGDGLPPTGSTGAFDDIQVNIFDRHCLSAGCHNAQSRAGNLNLSADVSYDQLVDVVPTNPVAMTNGMLRVDPFAPDNSFLVTKLVGPGFGEGSPMPMGMDPLPQSDIDAIEAWIAEGAPRGNTAAPTSSPTPSPVATATDTATETPTSASTSTASETPPPTPTDTPATPTATTSGTIPATGTATATGTSTATGTTPPSPSPTATEQPSATPTVTPVASLFAQIQGTIFNPTCTDVFCHDESGFSGSLSLVEGRSYDALVNVEPDNLSARLEGLLRVDPGNPDNSFLLIKLMNPSLEQGGRMPLTGDPLSAEQIQLVRDWIEAGAEP